MVHGILGGQLLTSLKEKASLYSGGGRSKKEKKHEDTCMTHFPKTSHWRPLVHNDESVDNATNLYLNNRCIPYFAEENKGLFWSDIILNTPQYPYVNRNL